MIGVLRSAVEDNSVAEVIDLLAYVKKHNKALGSDIEREACIDIALLNKGLDMVSLLLENGFISHNLDLLDSALLHAANVGHVDAAVLLPRVPGTNINALDVNGRTALTCAAASGHDQTVSALLQFPSININSRDRIGRTALIWATLNGSIAVVHEIINALAGRGQNGQTVLMLIAANGTGDEAAKLIKDIGDAIGISDLAEHKNALEYAQARRFNVIAGMLSSARATCINMQDSDGNTALMHAASSGNKKVVKQLLSAADIVVNNRNRNRNTAFDLFEFNSADRKLDVDILKLFLQKKANTTVRVYAEEATRIPGEIMTEALISLAIKKDNDAIAHAFGLGYMRDDALSKAA